MEDYLNQQKEGGDGSDAESNPDWDNWEPEASEDSESDEYEDWVNVDHDEPGDIEIDGSDDDEKDTRTRREKKQAPMDRRMKTLNAPTKEENEEEDEESVEEPVENAEEKEEDTEEEDDKEEGGMEAEPAQIPLAHREVRFCLFLSIVFEKS